CIYAPFSHQAQLASLYLLALHAALPISLQLADGARGTIVVLTLDDHPLPAPQVAAARHRALAHGALGRHGDRPAVGRSLSNAGEDRKSTRLNSSHVKISYAVFCLKKKKR